MPWRDMEILRMTHLHEAARAWEACVREAVHAKAGLEDEFGKRVRANTDRVKRRFDDEPFIREYFQRAHREGLLNALLAGMMMGGRGGGRKRQSQSQESKG
ncbi:hypothetical protein GALMADRAFT_148085 [Galerina marginata CBS 339.88]|uniref:Uncharacterized protein n=1 Tax=Galerina marginata (strain CBS 339.88) TaxID=685588 RepID=A0A067SHD5_GALM3|nr:hypothetical protein GALMADRAFT_148085 [Galerina marginata CBS 339.88]